MCGCCVASRAARQLDGDSLGLARGPFAFCLFGFPRGAVQDCNGHSGPTKLPRKRYALCAMRYGVMGGHLVWSDLGGLFERSRRLSLVLGSLGLGVFWGRLGGIRVSGASWSRRWRPREGVRTRDSGGGGLGGGYHGRGNQISPILRPPRFVSMHSPASPPLGRAHASGHDLLTPLLDAALLGDPEVGATPSHESKAFACCFGFLCFRDTVMPRLSSFCLLGGLG